MPISIPPLAPGCFGSALAFDASAPVCSICKFSASCKVLHEENMEALRDRMGLQIKKVTKKPGRPAAANGMTPAKKVLEWVDVIEKKGIKVTEAFREGRNPFDGQGIVFMRIVGHMLLKGRVNRGDLSMAFQKLLKWQDSTADAHARIGLQVLAHIGAIDLVDGAATLRR